MKRNPSLMYVFRCGKWDVCSSEDIVPGDVISLSFTPTADASIGRRGHRAFAIEAEKIVPCDALIIRGSCVVNEAMLTGESVPQVKESLRVASRDDEDPTEAKNGGLCLYFAFELVSSLFWLK
jgi:manganese-transporting P-type ATPase